MFCFEKSNLEIRGDDSLTHIKEEPVDHGFIEFQEPSRKNSVTENTAQPTKTGRHDIAEILLKVALNTKNQSINQLL
jgi:hypothetical protein